MWTDILDAISLLAVFALLVFMGFKMAVFPYREQDWDTPEPDNFAEEHDPHIEPWKRH